MLCVCFTQSLYLTLKSQLHIEWVTSTSTKVSLATSHTYTRLTQALTVIQINGHITVSTVHSIKESVNNILSLGLTNTTQRSLFVVIHRYYTLLAKILLRYHFMGF